MSKLAPEKPRKVVKVLEKIGFKKIRQSGSHAVFYHKGGTLRKILKDAGITTEEFNTLK